MTPAEMIRFLRHEGALRRKQAAQFGPGNTRDSIEQAAKAFECVASSLEQQEARERALVAKAAALGIERGARAQYDTGSQDNADPVSYDEVVAAVEAERD